MDVKELRDRKKIKSGFTLIELLAVIVILIIIFSFIMGIFMYLFSDVDEKIDKTTKNIILDAAEAYAIEYKDTDNWKEAEVKIENNDNNMIMFCISLDTLIDKGYFKNDSSNYDDYRNKYAVKGKGINGVYTYEFVELRGLEDNDICKYYRRDSGLIDDETGMEVEKIENSSSIIDEKTKNDLGDFKYKITSFKDNKYLVNLNLDINLYDVIENNLIYISVVLDKSGSMNGTKFSSAKNAILSFSTLLDENEDINTKMSLIEFGRQAVLRRDFEEKAFTSSDFTSANGGGTNASAGLDLVSSLIYNNIISDNSNMYTILLFDGAPYDYSKMKYTLNGSTRYISPKSIYDKNENYNIVGDANIYYKNYQRSIVGCQDKSNCNQYTTDLNEKIQLQNVRLSVNNAGLNEAWQHLTASSGYLKGLNSKLIVIGYGMDFGENAQRIASYDPDLCANSKDGNYCYYYSPTGSEISDLFNSLANNIIEYSSVNGVKLVLESAKSEDGKNDLINIFDVDENSVDKIEIEVLVDDNSLVDGNLNITDNYRFEISDYLFDEMNCADEKCIYDGSKQLFNIRLELLYPDNTTKIVEIEQPEFDIGMYKESILN